MVTPRMFPVVVAVASTLLLAGCQTRTESFAGKPTNQVWTAMVKAAEQPDYRDWHVIENDVWADEGSGRIEIWRLLRRYKDPAGQWSRLEDQEWKFSIELDVEAEPTATFSVRSMCVPSHSWMEAERYYGQVWTLLGGRPTPEEAAAAAAKASAPQPADAPAPAPKPVEAETPAPSAQPAAEPPVDLPT